MSTRGRQLRRRDTVLICQCGHATPVTTKAIAVDAIRRHVCRVPRPRAGLVVLPATAVLPGPVIDALERYACWREQRAAVVVDAIAVLKCAGGVQLQLNPHERFAVFALLRHAGWSTNRCTRELRLSWSTTRRFRGFLTDAADAGGITELAAAGI